MKNVIIRMVRSEDAEQYITLVNKVWRIAYKHIFPDAVFVDRDAHSAERIAHFSENHYNDESVISYAAEVDGKIAGIMFGRMNSNYQHFNDLGFADLEGLYIYPEYQGIGIASAFRKVFESWAKQNGAKKYVIGVLKDNLKARKVYEKWGGKLDDHTQPFVKLGVGYDEVFYTFDL